MPSGGHNRKPTHLKVIQGTARPSRMNKNEPKPPPIAPKCPARLPAKAKKEWRRLAPDLERLGLLTRLDRDALADLCLCIVRLEEAEQDIAKRGMLVPGGLGGMKRNPNIITAKEYRAALSRWCDKFGLNPAIRGSMNIARPEKEDDEEFFLFGRREAREGNGPV